MNLPYDWWILVNIHIISQFHIQRSQLRQFQLQQGIITGIAFTDSQSVRLFQDIFLPSRNMGVSQCLLVATT